MYRYVEPVSGKRMSLAEAVAKGLVEPRLARDLYSAMGKHCLAEHIELNHIDPVDGTYIHPVTNEQMSIKEAIEAGFIDPKSIFMVDPQTG